MRLTRSAVSLTLAVSLTAGAAYAAAAAPKCGDSGVTTEEDLAAAPSCAAAQKLHAACSYGASGDTGLAQVVIDKCEADFLPGMPAAQKRVYNAKLTACDAKYARRAGSVYVSAAAFCRENAAADYAKKFGRR